MDTRLTRGYPEGHCQFRQDRCGRVKNTTMHIQGRIQWTEMCIISFFTASIVVKGYKSLFRAFPGFECI